MSCVNIFAPRFAHFFTTQLCKVVQLYAEYTWCTPSWWITNFRNEFCNLTAGWFYAWKQLLLSAHLGHPNSLFPSVCLSITRVDQSKMVQARITRSSPSAAWKTL